MTPIKKSRPYHLCLISLILLLKQDINYNQKYRALSYRSYNIQTTVTYAIKLVPYVQLFII